MHDIASPEQVVAAAAYEELFVTGLFREWAPRVLDAAQVRIGHRVLDVGCGTGVLAREAATRVGPAGSVVGLDPNPGMLAVATRLAPSIDWRQGTAEELPFPDQSFDAVVSQFGLMFFANRSRALGEMARVVRSRGRLAVAVWDALENIPAYASEVALLERTAGTPAADALRAPFVLGDRRELAAMFEESGVDSLAVTTLPGIARFPSIRAMVEADLRGWLPVVGVVLSEEQTHDVLNAAENDLGPFRTADGDIEFAVSAHIVTGVKP